jgi:cytosine/adenosine deaminase-related metal-dependent hydrolase
MAVHDLVIRGGTVVDGTGAPRRTADVAVSHGRITEVGRVDSRGGREIDADGAVVAPGFVDIHIADRDALGFRPRACHSMTRTQTSDAEENSREFLIQRQCRDTAVFALWSAAIPPALRFSRPREVARR